MTAFADASHLRAAVTHYATSRGWDIAGDAQARHTGFFVRRRYATLAGEHADWITQKADPTPSDVAASRIVTRLDTELALAQAFVDELLGTAATPGPIFGLDQSQRPQHLDIADLARVLSDASAQPTSLADALTATAAGSATPVQARAVAFFDTRRASVRAIVWRALALEPALWREGADPLAPDIDRVALGDVVDRRLRTVEWMRFTITSRSYLSGAPDSGTTWSSAATPTSGWVDGFRTRRFEYPTATFSGAVEATLVAADAVGDGSLEARLTVPGHPWLVTEPGLMEWNRPYREQYPPAPPDQRALYFPAAQSADWSRSQRQLYRCDLAPPASGSGSAAIDRMFASDGREDYMNRCFLNCDHVLSAVHLEAFLFGLRRREATPAAAAALFDALCARPAGGLVGSRYVGLDSHVKSAGKRVLMADADDQHFDNVTVPTTDLQVGDQVVFWNHQLYSLLMSGDWRLENALVFDVQNDPFTGEIWWGNGYAIELCGHGMPAAAYGDYAIELGNRFAVALGVALRWIRQETERRNANDDAADDIVRGTGTFLLSDTKREGRLVRWTPYEAFQEDDPWWIRIFPDELGDLPDALALLPEMPLSIVEHVEGDAVYVSTTVEADPERGQWTIERVRMIEGYRPVPDRASVYFPLHLPVPASGQGWHGYFKERAAGNQGVPPLEYHLADGRVVPGFLFFGRRKDTFVVRPRVRPHAG